MNKDYLEIDITFKKDQFIKELYFILKTDGYIYVSHVGNGKHDLWTEETPIAIKSEFNDIVKKTFLSIKEGLNLEGFGVPEKARIFKTQDYLS